MKLVSVIIPVYQSEKSIKRCIDSILASSYPNIEVIAVNDGSKDQSAQILAKYDDERLVVINKKNEGVSLTRNAGIRYAKGEYVCFVDSDDYVEANYIEKMVETMENDGCDLVVSNFYQIDELASHQNNHLNEVHHAKINDVIYDIYVNMGLNQPWNKLFKKDLIIKDFDPSLSLGEDLIFNIDYLKQIESLSVIDDYLYYYDIKEGALHQQKQNIDEFLFLYQYMIEQLLLPIDYHENQFNFFFLKHFIRFIYDNKYDVDDSYQVYQQFINQYDLKCKYSNKLAYYALYSLYKMKKGGK